uniref:Uncharacterized protein LOC114335122 n=1 Tax=Diabrotica virgifera virgifera TaxID=50390 RepID=A0A6P7FX15_DIAVI
MDLVSENKKESNRHIIISKYQTLISQFFSFERLFTDGSKTKYCVASASVTHNEIKKYKLEGTNTILTGELFAIYKALSHVRKSSQINFLIITDSLNSLEIISKIYSPHPVAKLIRQELHNLNHKNVAFLWVPSHIGIAGNELADKHAREALEDATIEIYPTTPASDLKSYFHSKIVDIWNSRWHENQKQLFEVKPTFQRWSDNSKNRFSQVIISRLRLGHSHLTHGHLMTRYPQQECYAYYRIYAFVSLILVEDKVIRSFQAVNLRTVVPSSIHQPIDKEIEEEQSDEVVEEEKSDEEIEEKIDEEIKEGKSDIKQDKY